MNQQLTILVVGGYGEFGGRVAQLLIRDHHRVYVAGRHLSKAQTFTEQFGGTPIAFDRNAGTGPIDSLNLDVLVDAAGPFQNYADTADAYKLARWCIDNKTHYLDLSDDGHFTAGISCLNSEAIKTGCVVLSGVSSTPALSSAVVESLKEELGSISLIETTILPGSKAPRGRSVMTAILGQVGNPMKIFRGARWTTVTSWSASTYVDWNFSQSTVNSKQSGRPASFISTPDTLLFPKWFLAKSVLFRAGLELGLMHHSLVALGKLRRLSLLPTLTHFYKPLDKMATLLSGFGRDRGAMVVSLVGRASPKNPSRDAFMATRRSWSLIAEEGLGPFVAAAPTRAIVQSLNTIPSGARPCLSEISVDQIAYALRDVGVQFDTAETLYPALFQRALKDDWSRLPLAVKQTHLVDDEMLLKGISSVERGSSIPARIVAFIFRFPETTKRVEVSVLKRRLENGELWIRDFAGHRFQSTLTFTENLDKLSSSVIEQFGMVKFELDLSVSDKGMAMPVSRGWLFGIPLPQSLLPLSFTREYESNQTMHFDVRLELPFSLGLLVHYRGNLTVQVENPEV